MGRASNPSVPQRVSAHVVPKAQAFASEDEDEKTTIESGWEEEASTTVEQGDVAEKIRQLGIGLEVKRSSTNVTSTDGALSEELTVDDQRANPAVSLLPPPDSARLVITQGNDAGQSLDIRPGKTYTIGRGIDNDLVLTDPTVSRKHFDLRSDNGAWVLADRGSGNGTLVNTQLEDAPFMLASGDVIEIGNTSFRFELAAPPLPAVNENSRQPTRKGPTEATDIGDGDVDEESELSTVSGKPLREVVPDELRHAVMAPPPTQPLPARPKTLPPPAPLPRLRPPTNLPLPPNGFSDRQSPLPLMNGLAQSMPQPTLSLGQANRSPLLPPAILHDPPIHPQTTLPGQGPPAPGMQPLAQPNPARLPFAYGRDEQASQPSRSGHAPPGAHAIHTAHTAPHANRLPAHAQITQLGQHSQLLGLGSAPAIASQPTQPLARDATSTALVQPISYSHQPGVHQPPPRPAIALSRRTKLTLGAAGLGLFIVLLTIALVSGGGNGDQRTADKPIEKPAAEVKPTIEPIREPAPSEPAPTPAPMASAPQPTQPPPAPPPVQPQPVIAHAEPAPPPQSPHIDQPAIQHASDPAPDIAARVDTHKPPHHPDRSVDRPIDHKPDRPHTEAIRSEPVHTEPPPPPAKTNKHGKTQDVKAEANALYHAKNLAGASSTISAALGSVPSEDVADLKSLAASYSQLGRDYNVGNAPGAKTTDAYAAMVRARDLDRSLGRAYATDIDQRLAILAPRAAASFMAAHEYESAFAAVHLAEQLGSTSSTNKAVRSSLEDQANSLMRGATAELNSDPDDAKKKLREILGLVEPSNPLYARATKLLGRS